MGGELTDDDFGEKQYRRQAKEAQKFFPTFGDSPFENIVMVILRKQRYRTAHLGKGIAGWLAWCGRRFSQAAS